MVFCSGKIYYDLINKKRELDLTSVAIIRIEQLYPFPHEELSQVLDRYQNLSNVVWCQEEPMNQGAWYSSKHHISYMMQI